MAFDVIAFDADDTLWHTEHLYSEAKRKLAALLARYTDTSTLDASLDAIEIGNLDVYGYGVKSFTLSMIEAAVTLTEGRITGDEILQIVGLAREMLTTDVRLLDHVDETLRALAATHPLMVITKGDASEQVPKLARAGLLDTFPYVEVVGSKTEEVYRRLLAKHAITPERFLMVGNSLKSDILPVLALGGTGVYIPSDILWAHEHVDDPPNGHARYFELAHIGELPALVRRLTGGDHGSE
jgi:putative hydrolase of the HAD superfamily